MPTNHVCVRAALEQTLPYAALSPAELDALAQRCREVCLEPHEVLLHDGDVPTCSYILVEGALTRSLVTADGKSVLLNYTRPVTSFACACLLNSSPHLGVIEAAAPSQVVAVPGDAIERLVAENPAFASAMVRKLAGSSVRQTEALYDLMFPVPVRVARLLCRRADRSGSVELDMSKASMAEMLGTVPETLSRALATLRREGLIEVEGRTMRIGDLPKLHVYAQL